MKHLLIVGARGWGREVYDAAIHTEAYMNKEFEVKGFLDSKADALEGLKGEYPPILCAPNDYEIQPDDVFFIAMGDPKWRKHFAEMIERKGGRFMTIVCNGAHVNPTATIGEGTFIAGWSSVSDNVVIGRHTMIHPFSVLGHDVKVGEYCSIEAHCFLGGYAGMGDSSILHVRSTIIRHKRIGNNVEVGASSVVMRNFSDNLHVFGNPAKKLNF